jgi:hypothetical protein
MRGDGQVVVVEFNRMSVEVAPAFRLQNGQYWTCDTNNGGNYVLSDPIAEINHITEIDLQCNANLRPLIMFAKAWQSECSVPIKSFCLELVAAQFLLGWQHRLESYFYHDWMMRDFFNYLYYYANQTVVVPGTNKKIFLSNEWQSKALTAYKLAVEACYFERDDAVELAGGEWQKIFGTLIPRSA